MNVPHHLSLSFRKEPCWKERHASHLSRPKNWKREIAEGYLDWSHSYLSASESWGNFSVYLLAFTWQAWVNRNTRKSLFKYLSFGFLVSQNWWPVIFSPHDDSSLQPPHFSLALFLIRVVQFRSATPLCPTLCDPVDGCTAGFPVHRQLLELAQTTRVYQVGDAIQPSDPLLPLLLLPKFWIKICCVGVRLNQSVNKHLFITYCPGGSDGKESACNAGDLSSIPGLGRSPGEGNSNPLQYSCLENPMDRL